MRAVIVLAVLAAAAPAAAEKPRVKLDRVVAFGELPVAKVRRPLTRLTKQLAACHTDRQRTARIYGGTVSVAFTITPEGAVDAPAASGLDPDVATCVAAAVATAAFPTATAPTSVTFAVGFRVRADKVRARVAALAGTDGVDASGMDAVDLAARISDRQRRLAEASYSLAGGSHPGARSSNVVEVGGYLGPAPAAVDPSVPRTPAPLPLALGILLAHADGLRACLASTTASLRISLDIAATGTVTSTTILTPSPDPDRAACLTAAGAPLRFPALPGGTLLVVTLDRTDDTATIVTSPVP